MDWDWGGPYAYFKCRKCGRMEVTPSIVIEGNTVWKEAGNKREKVCEFPEEDRERVLRKVLGE